MVDLPITNEFGYYEIRIESIGGLGANLCGKMLGELGVKYLGLNSACFASYGSEKTGTPVKSYIRYCSADKEIRVHSPVLKPHMLVIFHEALLTDEATLAGVTDSTKIIINTHAKPEDIIIKFSGLKGKRLYCIDAQELAIKAGARLNMVIFGAIGKVLEFANLKQLCDICSDTVGKKYPDTARNNLEGIRVGFQNVIISHVYNENPNKTKDNRQSEATNREKQNKIMPAGGINPHFGNSVINDLSPSRQGYFPLFRKEVCINCARCDMTCPDMVFQFRKGIYKGREMMVNMGLDYYHCKGCLRCVEICPVNALVTAKEADYPNIADKPYAMSDLNLLRMPAYYEKRGADGYITSESFLTEKRINGGEL